MKHQHLSLFILISSLMSLTSCGGVSHPVSAYKKEMDYQAGFKIMQLTDIHLGIQSDFNSVMDLLGKEIKAGDPNLVVITGDTFMDATKAMVNKFFTYIDDLDVPFAFTYGNHDFQGDYDRFYIPNVIRKAKNAVFVDYDDDDLFGQTNYYININNSEGYTIYRLFIIDSNSYYSPDGLNEKYDIIHEEQITHIEKIVSEEGKVPSLAFYHIPLYEFKDAYTGYAVDKTVTGTGTNNEGVSVGYKRTDAFSRLKACGVQGMFIGHDHINNTTLYYQDVILSYGIKSTDEIYNDYHGYCLITLDGTSTLKMSDIAKVIMEE